MTPSNALVAFIILNVAAIVAVVAVNSFGTQWFTGWLPEAFTTSWYSRAWKEFQLGDVLWTTALAVGAEHFEWLGPMFNEQMHLKDGRMHVSDRPGLGFSLSEQALSWTAETEEFGKKP